MKKKIGLIMSIVVLFVFVFSGINNTYVAHADGNNEFVIGTNNLNNTLQNSAKIGDLLRKPEKGWKRYDDSNKNIIYEGKFDKMTNDNRYYNNTWTQLNPSSIGSTCKFNFVGTKIRIIGAKSDISDGNISINIDNKVYHFSAQSSHNANPLLLFESPTLQNKEHNVKIQIHSNKYGIIDAIDVNENGELKSYEETVEETIKVESISLDKTSMDLLEGSSDKLNAKVLPENATNKKVIWKSSAESIAKVDQEGKVTAIKEGQVTITAKVEGTDLIATCKVNVTKRIEENKNNAILSISLVNGATKEYDVNMQEVEKFINWFEERSNGKGPSLYSFNKKINPYKIVKEYIVHDKIASFEVREYEGNNK
ncbi:protein containing cell adhesion domain [Clostridium botulinum B str. Osaka05]|uniref:Protein containing cell adhesion domain n=1 Tax=Clostridium botulinum B str. Osaka05 TaxID=1407017 RepID=A0A0S6U0K2_CLOBO|nr:Ig-like domain-containing protein [Clostridium botulinum]GAE01902.1 protein containing cell adhesion domain [Clostridium botulinum B str. Osaka05]